MYVIYIYIYIYIYLVSCSEQGSGGDAVKLGSRGPGSAGSRTSSGWLPVGASVARDPDVIYIYIYIYIDV